MRKLKKVLAVALAAALVLSCAPLAGAVSALTHTDTGNAYTAGNGFEYGSDSFENPVSSIWVDTSNTTEVWRLNKEPGSFVFGNYLTLTSPTGIPKSCATGNKMYYATAGECDDTGVEPLIVSFKLYGATATVSDVTLSHPNFTSGWSAQSYTRTGTDSNGSYTEYYWDVTPDNTYCNVANGTISFTMTFKYNGATYSATAYAHSEYVFVPAGSLAVTRSTSNREPLVSALTLLYAKQARPETNSARTAESQYYGRINFLKLAQSENGDVAHLTGAGYADDAFDATTNDSFGRRTTQTNGDYGFIRKSSDTGSDGGCRLPWGTDAAILNGITIWMDKYTDHLGTGTNGTLTNGLNLRYTVKNTEQYRNHWNMVVAVGFNSTGAITSNTLSNTTFNVNYKNDNSNNRISAVGQTTNGGNLTWLCNQYSSPEGGDSSLYGIPGASPYLTDMDMASYRYILFRLEGVGPTSSQAAPAPDSFSLVTRIRGGRGDQTPDQNNAYQSNDTGTASNQERGYIDEQVRDFVRFRVYTTEKLRSLLTSIDKGEFASTAFVYGGQYGGLSQTTANITSVARTLRFPQSWMFTSQSWSNFASAYAAAKAYISDFTAGVGSSWSYTGPNSKTVGLEQQNIDNAIKNLINAYNALALAPAPKIKVHHVARLFDGTEVTAADDEIFTGWDANNNLTGAANPATPFKNGVKVNLYALTSLTGYVNDGARDVLNASMTNNGTSTQLYDVSNSAIGTAGEYAEFTFYYKPADNTLQVLPFKPESNIYINSGIKTGQTPINFASIMSSIGGYEKFNFEGLYTNGDTTTFQVSGTKINPSTWKMPEYDARLYVNWQPKDVELHVATSLGGDVAVGTAQTPPVVSFDTDTKETTLGTVSFSRPTPPTVANADFVNYYRDPEFTQVIQDSDWPITASYDAEAQYPITEVTSSDVMTPVNNKVTVYALYADLSNKIFFDAQGGTMPTGYEDNVMTYTQGTPFTYPVPTRNGYDFTGWVDADGNPIDSSLASVSAGQWTYLDSTTKTGYAARENGTITMNSSTGFVCYATWAPHTITLTFRLSIPSSEASSYNSSDSAANPYYVVSVDADAPITEEMLPASPRRYGWTFSYWEMNSRRMNIGDHTPTEDTMVYAHWAPATTTAFADLTSYIKYGGEDQVADLQHGEPEIEAAPGDIVNIRFSVSGNFFTGASSFIFGYNQNFYENVAGADILTLNGENAYIDGIKAEPTVITNYTANTIADYTYSSDETANTKVVMVTIDPDVYAMGTYNTVSLADDTYILEIKLKIKDTAQSGDMGSVWLALEQLRTADNIMGDLFISYTATAGSLEDVETTAITFDTDTVASTVMIAEEERPDTTVYVVLPADANGNKGSWAGSGNADDIPLTGPEGTEILSVTVGGVTYNEFPIPEKTGYTFDGFYKYDTATGQFDMTDELGTGCYGTEAQNGNTYGAVWVPDTHTIRFFNANETLNKTVEASYDQVGGITPPTIVAGGVYTLKGWIPYDPETGTYEKLDENLLTSSYFSTDYQVQGDASFIAWTVNVQKTPYLYAYKDVTVDPDTGTTTYTPVGASDTSSRVQLTAELQEALGIEVRYGDTLVVTESATACSMVENGTVSNGNPNYTVTISLQQVDLLLRRQKLVSDGAVSVTTDDNEYAEYNSYNFAYVPTAGGLTAANSRNYEVVATYLDSAVTTAPSYSVTFDNTPSPTVYIAYQGGVVIEKFNAAYQAATFGWDTANLPSNMTVDGAVLNVRGRYDQAYDVDAITALLVEPFGYKFASWNPTTNLGTHRGLTKTIRHTPYQVTAHFYNEAGTTELSTATANYNANLTTAAASVAPEKSGYTFAGWVPAQLSGSAYAALAGRTAVTGTYDLDAAANDPENTIVVTTTSTTDPDTGVTTTTKTYDIYFVASYTINNYNVIYKVDGTADATLASNADYGATYTVAQEPEKTGYTFDGWYDEAAPTVKVNAGSTATMGSADVTYNGTFTANSYTVTFDENGGAYAEGQNGLVTVTYDSAITVPANNPTKAGYAFIGWASTNNATAPDFAAGTILNDTNFTDFEHVTYYAVWEEAFADYSIDFYYENADDDGYTKDASKTISGLSAQIGTTVSVDQATYETGAATGFVYKESTSGTVAQDNSLVLNVYYDRVEYTLTKDVDGVTSSAGTFKYGADLTGVAATLETPVKEHYVFNGWSLADNTMPVGGTTITALFTEEQYTLAYDLNGGTGTIPAGGTVRYNQSNYALPGVTFSKTGYTFDGWYLGTDGNNLTTKLGDANESITIGDLGANGDTITVYAKWLINTYTFTYKYDADNEYTTQPYEHGDTVTAPADPTKAGYTFSGWSPALPATATADRTFIAVWTPINYTITFNTDGGSAVDSITAGYETSVNAPATVPTKEGYTFAGWYTGAGVTGTAVEWPVSMPLGGTEFYAHWTVNSYTIDFNSDGGTAVASITQDYGTAITAPAAPTKEGYTFAGWSPALPETMPALGNGENGQHATYTAQWTANSYKIVFNTDGGSEVADIVQDYGTAVTAPAAPTKAGYDFAGWQPEVPATMPVTPASGLELTAQWTPHTYTLVYDLNGGTNVDITINSTVTYGDVITLPTFNANFTYEGHSFANWSDGTATYGSGASYTVPAQAANGDTITLTASYTTDAYTFYYMDGATTIDSIADIDYGTSIASYGSFDPTATYAKPGYTFMGWYDDASLTTVYSYDTMPANDVYVYARYDAIEYTVEFASPDDVTGEGFITFNNGASYFAVNGVTVNNTIASADTESGLAGNYDIANYRLVGWTLDPTADIVVTYTLDQIGAWTAAEFAEDLGNSTTLTVYPLYERVAVTLDVIPEDVAVDIEEGTPNVGYIYNVGDRRTKAQVEQALDATGNGSIVVTPTVVTKKGEFCGSGSKVEVIDNLTNEVVEVYYLVVFGDVNGDAVCSALDYSIMAEQNELTADYQTWGLTDDSALTVTDLTAEQQIKCKCYVRAADVDDTEGFDSGDVELVYMYVLKIYPYDFNKEGKKYFIDTTV